jgi:hypothetical protein
MLENSTIELQDVAKATGTHSVRISEALIKLGGNPGNSGRRSTALSLGDAIRAALVRRCMDVGLTFESAVTIVTQITADELADMFRNDRRTWLCVGRSANDPNHYLWTLCDLDGLREIGGPNFEFKGIQIVDVYATARDVVLAVAERERAANAPTTQAKAQQFVAQDRQINGCVIDGLSIAVLRKGRGIRMTLTPIEARAIAQQLLTVAEEFGAPAPEKLN